MPRRSLPGPLRLFLLILILCWVASIADCVWGYLHHGRAGTWYFWPGYPAFDFVDYTLQFPYLHTPVFFTLPVYRWYYPAPAIFALYPFYKVAASTNRVVGYGVFAATVIGLDLLAMRQLQNALARSGLRRSSALRLVSGTALFGWPVYFGLQRGNIESLLWLGVAAGVFLLLQRRYTAGAALLGVVGSAKLYPLLFLALLLQPKRFRELGVAFAAACVTTLAALRFLEPNVAYAWRQVNDGIQTWSRENTQDYGAIGVDHSLFGVIRLSLRGTGVGTQHALTVYLIIATVVSTAVFFLRVVRLPRPNQLLYVACATVLLPPTSYDYTLVAMLIPWGWLAILCVQHMRAEKRNDHGGCSSFPSASPLRRCPFCISIRGAFFTLRVPCGQLPCLWLP